MENHSKYVASFKKYPQVFICFCNQTIQNICLRSSRIYSCEKISSGVWDTTTLPKRRRNNKKNTITITKMTCEFEWLDTPLDGKSQCYFKTNSSAQCWRGSNIVAMPGSITLDKCGGEWGYIGADCWCITKGFLLLDQDACNQFNILDGHIKIPIK